MRCSIMKTFRVSCISCMTVLSLAGCADMTGLLSQEPSTDQQVEAEILLPNYAKGSWYAYNDGSRDIVVEVNGETIVWQDEKGRLETRYRNPILPRLKWPHGETEVIAEPNALWPLMPGKMAFFRELRSEFDLNRQLTESKARVWRCSVQDPTILDTEAGSFETFPISCEVRSRGGANKLLGNRLWHYAPEVGHYVRREKIDSSGTREIRELVARG